MTTPTIARLEELAKKQDEAANQYVKNWAHPNPNTDAENWALGGAFKAGADWAHAEAQKEIGEWKDNERVSHELFEAAMKDLDASQARAKDLEGEVERMRGFIQGAIVDFRAIECAKNKGEIRYILDTARPDLEAALAARTGKEKENGNYPLTTSKDKVT